MTKNIDDKSGDEKNKRKFGVAEILAKRLRDDPSV